MDCNMFKFCTGLRFLGYFMIVLVSGIIALSYYAVVVINCGPMLKHGGADLALAVLIIVLFHVLLVLLMWSYVRVVFEDPGSVPNNWRRVGDGDLEDGGGGSLAAGYAAPGVADASWPPGESSERRRNLGYCGRCRNGKPPRCHHCSICQRCVLKMDHHCIWVVNCVGARNYKFFLLFLLYTFFETALDCIVLLPGVINFFNDAKSGSASPGNLAVTFLAFVLNVAFALSLLGFVIMHISLVLSNTTSVEVHEKKKGVRWKYDLGRRRNFEQVFGTKKILWLFPLISKEDLDNIPALSGLDFPTRSDMEG